MPSIFSRKPCTKCWRACSPSVTMSTPASSCSFTARMAGSRLAPASSWSFDFQAAPSVVCPARTSGFWMEAGIVGRKIIKGVPRVFTRGRFQVIQWVMWQMGGLGPMLGQHGHFAVYAKEKIPYAIERYRDEAARLYRVLDTQLGKTGSYVAGDYSIADIACFPWTMTHKAQGFTLDDYPNLKRWYAEVRARPQVQAGAGARQFVKEPFDEEARKNMFGQKAKEMVGKK